MIESSPWYKLYHFAPPHFPFCGEMATGWVLDPVDTSTSLFYLFAGLLILKEGRDAPRIVRNIGMIPLFVTLGSTLFHMSFTYIFLIADFMGIFYLNFYGIFLNFTRLNIVKKEKIAFYSFWGSTLYGIFMALSYQLNLHSGALMLPLLLIFLVSEWRCRQKEKGVLYRSYWIAFSLIALGYGAMLSEGPPYDLGCSANSLLVHYHLHSIWHLLSATSMIFIFRFYNQGALRASFLNSALESQMKS